MIHLLRSDIDAMDRRRRANLINSAGGFKPVNLIGTASESGGSNLAVFNSVVHVGANPPLMGIIVRPAGDVPRHTLENIRSTGVFTINHVHESFVANAHFTSAKFARGESEFEKCGLKEQYVEGFGAPFVAESEIKLGLKLVDEIPIAVNRTILLIGEVLHLFHPENALRPDGSLDLNLVKDVCVSGLVTYHRVEQIAAFPYAKPDGLPEFEKIDGTDG